MIQGPYIYHAFYFEHYYISSTSDNQALDPGSGDPWLKRKIETRVHTPLVSSGGTWGDRDPAVQGNLCVLGGQGFRARSGGVVSQSVSRLAHFLRQTFLTLIILENDPPIEKILHWSQHLLESPKGTHSSFFGLFLQGSFLHVRKPWLVTLPSETSLKLHRWLVNSEERGCLPGCRTIHFFCSRLELNKNTMFR